MAEEQQNLEQNRHAEPKSHMAEVVTIGFFGGVFWSFIGYIAYFFNFTSIGPALALNPLALGEWKNEALGQWLGILVIGILSIGIAILYNALFKKTDNFWIGIVYGLILWVVIFYLFHPIFPDLKRVAELDRNTIITTLCIYALYGMFIGYSISYHAHEIAEQKQQVNYSKQ